MGTHYSSKCRDCRSLVDWVSCPTGGWWSHRIHPADDHDADVDWRPNEKMNDTGEWVTY